MGEPLTLVAFARDPDNLPARRDGKPQPGNASGRCASTTCKPNAPRTATPRIPRTSSIEPPSSIVPASGPGLRLSWIVYRGKAAAVTFSPDQMKTWIDTRAYANSPWSPPYIDSRAASGQQVDRTERRSRNRARMCSVRLRATAPCSPMTT